MPFAYLLVKFIVGKLERGVTASDKPQQIIDKQPDFDTDIIHVGHGLLITDGETAPDSIIHSTAQVSGSIASANDIISLTRFSTLPYSISTVKQKGTPLNVFLRNSTIQIPSCSLWNTRQPFLTAISNKFLYSIAHR